MRREQTRGRKPTGKIGYLARLKARVVAVVEAIPEGRVTTYGAIARHLKATPRQVAAVLANFTPEESATLPWFRVVAANGVVSTVKLGEVGRLQIERLREEGVAVNLRHKVEAFDALSWLPGGQTH